MEGIPFRDVYRVSSFVAWHPDRSEGGLLRVITEEGGTRNIARDSILQISDRRIRLQED